MQSNIKIYLPLYYVEESKAQFNEGEIKEKIYI